MSAVNRSDLQNLVDDYPEKAVDILVNSLQHKDIEKEIIQFLLHPGEPQKRKPQNAPEIANAPTVPTLRTSHSWQYRPRSSSVHRHPPPYPVGQNAEPMSPPTSRSKSMISKDGKENINILATDEDDDIKAYLATMRPAAIDYSIVGEHMFAHGRICDFHKEEIDPQQILVPYRGVAESFRQVVVSYRAELTWKRAKTNSTHSAIFYLVPPEFLDIDVLLGNHDSGLGMPETGPSPPRRGPRLNFDEHAPSAHSDNFVTDSFHRSDLNTDFNQPSRDQPNERIHEYVRSQSEHAAAAATSRSNPGTISYQQPIPHQQPIPYQEPIPLGNYRPTTAETVNSTQASSHDSIRVSCTLDSSTWGFRLNLNADSQALYDIVQAKLEKNKGPFDRTTVLILFACDKQTSGEVCELSLGEEELEADWEGTVAWIRDNKRERPPHMYATIQFEEG
ncbi:hypothetical protein HBI56_067720 [Parastagonospora nodorum]|nr:hypothetical protein HBH53_129860 [Parastagonospora nodorum]KAH4068761.1 hypothetical protein HBH50_118470 [Parastagonospora nodorum]KAH4100351.1 hypothetical protein HBH48_020010 [Parastagonospora nodorum]KAH4105749.1 hypothetical protein HBH46_083150 [Parastagonospora nodorum]KAH4122320.1 hypothetical protein HBH47_087820 [Parastagonospora nodorum]